MGKHSFDLVTTTKASANGIYAKGILPSLRGLLFCILLFVAQPLRAQILEWVFNTGNVGYTGCSDHLENIAVDDAGFIYSTGFHCGADFDPGPDTLMLPNPSTSGFSAFVQKLDPERNLVWAVNISGTDNRGSGIAVDKNGNVYVTGFFKDTADILSVNGAHTFLFSAGEEDIFLLKLNPAGAVVWAGSIGSIGNDQGFDIEVDGNGFVYVTGIFIDTVDMDPGPGVFILAGTFNDYEDAFTSKLDSSGNLMWVKTIGGYHAQRGVSVAIDNNDNVYTAGWIAAFSGSVDLNPDSGVYLSPHSGLNRSFIQKLDAGGNFIWARTNLANGGGASVVAPDAFGNAYVFGNFADTIDFDPGPDSIVEMNKGQTDLYLQKFDNNGNLAWVKFISGYGFVIHGGMEIDKQGSIYLAGRYSNSMDADPGPGVFLIPGSNESGGYTIKLDAAGNLVWATSHATDSTDAVNSQAITLCVAVDHTGNVYTGGTFTHNVDFDPGPGEFLVTGTGSELFLHKLRQQGIAGYLFHDFNQNCVRDSNESALPGIKVVVNPGNYAVLSTSSGYFTIDSLPAGTYTIAADTSGNWKNTCPTPQTFTITNPDSAIFLSPIGLRSTIQCAIPSVSIHVPFLRPCRDNQHVYVHACNLPSSTAMVNNAYVIVQLDTLLVPAAATRPYTTVGNNIFRFDIGNLVPGECVDFSIACSLSCAVLLGQTICVEADMYPADSCAFDTIPDNRPLCTSRWDRSNLEVHGYCENDSIFFIVKNTNVRFGTLGHMLCKSGVRIYVDGILIRVDSIQLAAEDSVIFAFSGDGRTWRLEADQHPMHPGDSHPNATVEICGNPGNWTPGLVTILPQDDADAVIDIYCGLVTAAVDPNDKTGFPTGAGQSHALLPNGQVEYLVRFQNTGTDTAFMVIVRDTVDADFDILSVTPGVASHPYVFSMHVPRVLEWRFYNILLPDSNVDEQSSHGFLTYTVRQNGGLANGVTLENEAAIYFDYNDAVITNEVVHTIDDGLQTEQLDGHDTLTVSSCGAYTFNGFTYTNGGTYFQTIATPGGADKLITLNLTVNSGTPGGNSDTTITASACTSYSLNGQTFLKSGTFIQSIPNTGGCDSTITLNLSLLNSSNSTLTEAACGKYEFNGQTYTASGTFTETFVNAAGCDSMVALELTIHHVDTSVTQTAQALAANASGASYQWINCDSGNAVAGQTNAVFSPTADGDYAVVVTTGTCSDTSGCRFFKVTGIDVLQPGDITLFPQPAQSQLTVVIPAAFAGAAYRILDPMGKSVMDGTLTAGRTAIDIENLSTGIYLFSVNDNVRKKLVVFRD